jgi:hypothetical protein
MRAPILVSALLLTFAAATASCDDDKGTGGGSGGMSGGSGGTSGGSGGAGGGGGGSGQAFAQVEALLNGRCTTCHTGAGAALPASQDLRTGMSYDDLVGVVAEECTDGRLRVAPGMPSASYLVDKLKGINLCGGSVRMPFGLPPLSDSEIAMVEGWIMAGAAR